MSVDIIGALIFGGLIGLIVGIVVGAVLVMIANERGIKLPW